MSQTKRQRSSRLQLVLTEKDEARIDTIRRGVFAESKSAAIRAAIDLYFLLLQERDAGSTLLLTSQTESGPREREIFIF